MTFSLGVCFVSSNKMQTLARLIQLFVVCGAGVSNAAIKSKLIPNGTNIMVNAISKLSTLIANWLRCSKFRLIGGMMLPMIALISAVAMINELNKKSRYFNKLTKANMIASVAKHQGSAINAKLAINKLMMINLRFWIYIELTH